MIAKIFHSKKLIHSPLKNYFNVKNRFEPYLKLGRYDKPIGTLLLFLPCTWGIALGLPSLETVECDKIKKNSKEKIKKLK